MSPRLLHLVCADLHPGCPAHLHGESSEELVLAYLTHRCGGRIDGPVVLEELLSRVTVTALAPRADAPAVRAGRSLVG